MPHFGRIDVGRPLAPSARLAGGVPHPGSPDALAALARHPRFAEAADCAAAGALAFYSGRTVANRILNDRGRLVFSILVLDLAFRAEAGGEAATVTRLRALLSDLGVASPNRVSAMVAAMRLFGYLTLGPGPDRRSRALLPTPTFLAETRRRWAATTAATVLLFPSLAPVAARLDDPAVMRVVVATFAGLFRGGYRVADVVPGIAPYAERDGGVMVLLALREEGFTIAGTARRFHLSRAHVAKVVDQATDDGLATREGPRGGRIAPTPALDDLVRHLFATGILAQAMALEAAAAARPAAQRSAASAAFSAAASSGAPASTPER